MSRIIGRNNELQKSVRAIEDPIERLKAKAISGDSTAAHNIAVEYRIRGRRRLAFQWWRRAAALDDGEAWLEVAYCYHHGLGTRRNPKAAAGAYESAIRSETICRYSLEEALYHRAVLLLECDNSEWTRASASRLLRQASEDGDYEQASSLLSSIKSGERVQPCSCRRGLSRALGGAAQCRLHRYGTLACRDVRRLMATFAGYNRDEDGRKFEAHGFWDPGADPEVLLQHVFSKCCDREIMPRLPDCGDVDGIRPSHAGGYIRRLRRIPSTSPQ